MALSESAVSELLEAFRAGQGVDLIRESVRMVTHKHEDAAHPEHDGTVCQQPAARAAFGTKRSK